MTDKSLKEDIIDQITKLPEKLQVKVLSFAMKLQKEGSKGVKGSKLLQFEGAIDMDDLNLIEEAIAEGCESIDTNGW